MNESVEKAQKFEEYYGSIAQKFTNSLPMYLSAVLNRHGTQDEIGDKLKNIKDCQEYEILFILIIKEADISWLSGVKAILEQRLLSLRKIWKARVLVLNHDLARRKGLINNT